MITFVYAQDRDRGIGYENDIPWSLPSDMKHFKDTTMGHTMIMGRRTFESMNRRLLPGRKTVVVTRQQDYGQDIEGLTVVNSVPEVLKMSESVHLMVIGGADIFKQMLPYADQIIRTVIDASFPSDTLMPPIDTNEWTLIKSLEGIVDERNKYPHRYEWWQRKRHYTVSKERKTFT